MAKTKRIPKRSEVRESDTWDLSVLFKNDEDWHKALKKQEKKVPHFEKFRGRLGESPNKLRECYQFEAQFDLEMERIGHYAFLKASEDVSNSTYQGMVAQYRHLATVASEAASFIAPEIQQIPDKTMADYLKSKALQEYRFSLERLLRYKPHILSDKEERLLAMQGEVAGTAGKVFGQLNDADLKFGFVKDEHGNKVELTHSSYRVLLESRKRSVRKEAFHKLYDSYEQHANTLSATLSSSVLQDVYYSKVRNHGSALQSALFGDNVPVAVYDNLIATVHKNLDTVYRYLDLRRRALKLKKLHVYDTYVPIVELKSVKTPYEKAASQVCDALAPLGDEYVKVLRKGLGEARWVDRYENTGKRSGAFSAGGYEGPPYILMNYEESTIDSMFTLAHEAGHSMHTYYSAHNQPFHYYDYTIFVAEVASTFNELLLNKHLKQQIKHKDMLAFLLCREIDEIRGTLVRQTMFAEFEKVLHGIAEQGEPLTLARIREEYGALLLRYFGSAMVIDEALTLEGLRIPHFYNAFYVYKYATGISAAIALSRKVLEGGKAERDAYLRFLKGGGSKYPLDLLRDAGVDMSQPEPIEAAMTHFGNLVSQLESIL
ncbi:MAG: oligopeptidase [Candidatus Hydrogenedentota bacterium]